MTYGSSSPGIRQLPSATSIGVIYVPISGGTEAEEGGELGKEQEEEEEGGGEKGTEGFPSARG